MLKIEAHYKNGKEEGLATHWYWSGNKKSKVLWKNGQRKDSKLCGLSLVKRNMEILYG
jgi:antitoxin component YwqK of YwqJK toxin-antitoxin module